MEITKQAFCFSESANFIISLEHRVDRRNEIRENLESLNFRTSNFNFFTARLDKNFGGIGCGKSHILALTEAYCRFDAKYICILEDDFHFRNDRATTEELIRDTIQKFPKLDVLLLAGTNFISGLHLMESVMKSNHTISSVFESQSTAGYICHRDYAPTLISIFFSSVQLMEKYRGVGQRDLIYSRFAIDQMWKTLQRIGAWYALIPMLGEQSTSYSDIEHAVVDYNKMSA
jgi:glycosyl transferase family 25